MRGNLALSHRYNMGHWMRCTAGRCRGAPLCYQRARSDEEYAGIGGQRVVARGVGFSSNHLHFAALSLGVVVGWCGGGQSAGCRRLVGHKGGRSPFLSTGGSAPGSTAGEHQRQFEWSSIASLLCRHRGGTEASGRLVCAVGSRVGERADAGEPDCEAVRRRPTGSDPSLGFSLHKPMWPRCRPRDCVGR